MTDQAPTHVGAVTGGRLRIFGVKHGIKHHLTQLVRYVSISHIKPTALRSVEKKQFKKKMNQHQNKKLGEITNLHAVS